MTFNPLFRTALLAGLIGTAGAAAAQGWGGPHHHGFGGGEEGFALLHAVSLTDAQRTQVHATMKSGFEATESTREQLRSVETQIKAKLLATGSVAMADVAPLLQQKETLMAQLDQARMATVLQVRALLTPDQISKAASVEQQMQALHAQERALMSGDGK